MRATRTSKLGPRVAWYGLHTTDVQRAQSNYSELFGWQFSPPVDLGSLGILHPFAWERSASLIGSMMDISGRAGVHPHWLFHFAVDDVAAAVKAVRAAGGIVVDELALPTGERLAVCDDPQGAAFAVRQVPAPMK